MPYVEQKRILSNIGVVVMAKMSASKPAGRGTKSVGGRSKSGGTRSAVVQRGVSTAQVAGGRARFEAVMRAAEQSGLLSEKSGRIGGRVSPVLIRQAKRQTGIEADTDLIEFALATVALEDNFAKAFKESRGKVDPRLKLGF
jgi:hypothetical protein